MMMTEQVAPEVSASVDAPRPSLKTDIAYAFITLGSSMLWAILSGWLLYFYLPPEGEGVALVPAALYGIVTFAIRIINAALSPAIGHLSDNVHSKWGRRLPLMFISGVPMLAFFVLLWTPPLPHTSPWNLLYLGGVLIVYNLAYGLNQIPYTALLPELALTDQHRVRISAWASSFMLLGMILSGMAGLLIDRVGYPIMALMYAVASLPLFYLPFLVLRERPERYRASVEGAMRRNLRQAIASMFENKAFVVMTATGIFYWGLTTLVQSAIPYIVTEICLLTQADTMWFYIPAILASLVCYPLITWLSGRWGKWKVFSGSLLASAVVLPGLMLINERWAISLSAQGIIWIVVQAVALSGVTMLPMAFGAEIADYDAKLTGQRREGLYYASWGLLDQLINGLVAAGLPLLLLLGRSHTDPNGPLGVRLIGVVGGGMMLVAFFIFQRYPFQHKRGN